VIVRILSVSSLGLALLLAVGCGKSGDTKSGGDGNPVVKDGVKDKELKRLDPPAGAPGTQGDKNKGGPTSKPTLKGE